MSFSQDAAREIGELKRRLERLETYDTSFSDYNCRVYNSANISHSSSGSFQALTFDSERWDTDTMHSTVSNTGRITINTAGLYVIVGSIQWAANATGRRLLRITRDGSTVLAQDTKDNLGASVVVNQFIVTQYDLAATNYLTLDAYQNSGGSLNVLLSANISPEFMAARIA